MRMRARHRVWAVAAAALALVAGVGGGTGAGALAGPSIGGAPVRLVARHTARVDGPFAVGSRTETFVDASRPTAPNGTYPGAPSRTLSTLILYPAQGAPGGAIVPGATPARTGRRFPLVVFSHGFTASGPAYAPLLARWAAAGYVIAAPTFPLSSHDAPGGSKLVDYLNQPGDVSFVISEMLRLDHDDRHGLRHRIAADRVGVAGHSLGAITTLGVAFNSCCRDGRIKAAVVLSGIALGFPGGTYFTGLSGTPAPLLLVHGDHDQTVPYGGSVAAFAGAGAPKFFVTLIGARHTPFLPPWLDPIVRSVTDFNDRYLKREHNGITRLEADGNVAGVASLQEAAK